MNENKLSFKELAERFENKFGTVWCNDKQNTEHVIDTFIDYVMSLPAEQFDYEKVNNLMR